VDDGTPIDHLRLLLVIVHVVVPRGLGPVSGFLITTRRFVAGNVR
jgi:hypothetical protein